MCFDHTCNAVKGSWLNYKWDIFRLCGKDLLSEKEIIDKHMEARVGVLTIRNTDGKLQRKQVEAISREAFRDQFKKVEKMAGEVFPKLNRLIPLTISFVVSLFYKGDYARFIVITCVVSLILGIHAFSKSNRRFLEEADKLAQQYTIFGQQIFDKYVKRLEFKPNDADRETIAKSEQYKHLLTDPKAKEESLAMSIGVVFNEMIVVKVYAIENDPDAAIVSALEERFNKESLVFVDKQ